ncbi:protein OCTOPUS-like [Andrographis paniculata]|uniref:protein OCTOPUS-like n=1 Tax=Andrographis paniculata TaxID=175694 RepID=UPI0021E70C94|nr:protein OCTOPUS-like [Andrographis paniculata]
MVMSTTFSDPTAPPPPPRRPSFICVRHPNGHYTGFCPSCLSERLTTVKSCPSAAVKFACSSTFEENNLPLPLQPPKSSDPVSFPLKPKDRFDIGTPGRKILGGAFWEIFSKKWRNWRGKHKNKKQRDAENLASLSNQFRETQPEVGDYGFGRRSCEFDTNPRFSVDAGRSSSLDIPEYSFEEPRASWDGYIIGTGKGRSISRMAALKDSQYVHASESGSCAQIPAAGCMDEDVSMPGGSRQTKDYYLGSSLRRRCNKINKNGTGASVVAAEIDDRKIGFNSKVLPTTIADGFCQAEVLVGEKDMDSTQKKNVLLTRISRRRRELG